jgi:ABC-type transport system involved in cytochrome c biogenesis permease component
MGMIFLPVVQRELRVGARKRKTYFARLAGAFIPIAVGTWLGFINHNRPPQNLGRELFGWMGFLIFLFAFFAGARFTADCLSEEKREGTLGLLFLTDLKSMDIILGKLAATSLSAFYGLLAFFPIAAICLLLGGVSYSEFWRVVLVGCNLVFFSLAAGMVSSAICQDDRRSAVLTVAIMIFFTVASPIIGFASARALNFKEQFVYICPVAGCFLTPDSEYKGHELTFWINQGCTFLIGLTFLHLAGRWIKLSWLAESRKIVSRSPIASTLNKSSSLVRRRKKFLEINPFLWLVARSPRPAVMAWVTLGVCAGLWIWGYSAWNDWANSGTYLFTAVILHTLYRFAIATEACRRFVADRRSGALELLLSSPLTVKQLVQGQLLGLVAIYGGPILVILGFDLIFYFFGLSDSQWLDRPYWTLLCLGGIFIFLLDLVTISVVSMWHGMTHSKANRAAGSSFAKIMIFPGIVFALIYTIGGVMFPGAEFLNEKATLFLWFAMGILNDLLFLGWALSRLYSRFRIQATIPLNAAKAS